MGQAGKSISLDDVPAEKLRSTKTGSSSQPWIHLQLRKNFISSPCRWIDFVLVGEFDHLEW